MAEREQVDLEEIRTLTSQIVEAYVAHHTVALSELSALIATVGRELARLEAVIGEQGRGLNAPSILCPAPYSRALG